MSETAAGLEPIRRHEDIPDGYRHWKNIIASHVEHELKWHGDDAPNILVAAPFYHPSPNIHDPSYERPDMVGLYVKLPPKPWLALAEKIMDAKCCGGCLEVQEHELAELLMEYAEEIAALREHR